MSELKEPPTKKIAPPIMKAIALTDIQISKTNPRTLFDEEGLKELILSITEKGVIQPIVVRLNPHGKGKEYELICGERRLKASIEAKTGTIPAVIRALNDDECLELQIIENLHRKDVHPMEEAAAFKSIMDTKKFDLQELAKRVGKAASYVAQRLRYNDLIAEYQKAFFKGQITANEAFRVFRLSAKSQKEMWNEHHKSDTGFLSIDNWVINKYLGDLKKASFDTADALLKKDVGSCTNCPYNSGSNALLFPDEKGMGTCGMVSCFTQKVNLAYSIELKKALENPIVEIIADRKGPEVDRVKKMGHKVLMEFDNFNEINAPEFDEIDREDCESEGEYKEEVTRAKKEFEKEMVDYQKKVKSGKFVQGFAIEGSEKGKYVLIELKKEQPKGSQIVAAFKEKVADGKVTAADLTLQINGIRDREKRAKELDEEKIAPLVFELLKNEKRFTTSVLDLTIKEKIAHVLLLFQSGGSSAQSKMAKVIGKGSDYKMMGLYKHLIGCNIKKLDTMINGCVRILVIDKMYPANGMQVETHGQTAIVQDISFDYNPSATKKIRDEQMAVQNERVSRVTGKLMALENQRKELSTSAKKKNK